MKVDDPKVGFFKGPQKVGRHHMHESQTHDQIRSVLEDQPRQFRIVFLPRRLDSFGGCRVLLLIFHEVVVGGWDIGSPCAFESKCIFAIREDSDDLGWQLSLAGFVDHCLEIRSAAGYKNSETDW